MTETAWKSGIRRGSAAMADPDLGLDGHRVDGRRGRPGGSRRRCPRSVTGSPTAVPAGAVQPPNSCSTSGRTSMAAEVAGDDEGGPAGSSRPLVGAAEVRPGSSPSTVSRVPARRSVVGRGRRVDRRRRRPRSARRRGSACAWRRSLRRSSRRRSTSRAGNVGSQHDLRQQLQRRRQAVGRDVDADGQGIPAGLGVERGAEPFGRLDELRSHRTAPSPRTGHGRPGPSPPASAAGSSAAPPRIITDALIRGRPGRSAIRTSRPLARRSMATAGNSYGRGGPGSGRSAITGSVARGSIVRLMPPPPRRRPGRRRERQDHVIRRGTAGQVRQDQSVVLAEDGSRRVADLLGRDREVTRQQLG